MRFSMKFQSMFAMISFSFPVFILTIFFISLSALLILFSIKYLGESSINSPSINPMKHRGAKMNRLTQKSTSASAVVLLILLKTRMIQILPMQKRASEKHSTKLIILLVVSSQIMHSSWQGWAYMANPMMAIPKAPKDDFSSCRTQTKQRIKPMIATTLAEMVLNFLPLMLESQEKISMPRPSKAPRAYGHWNESNANQKVVAQMPAIIQQNKQMAQMRIWNFPSGFKFCSRVLYSLMVLTCVNFILIYLLSIILWVCFKYNHFIFMNIFSNSTQFPLPLYPIITILLSVGLYLALFLFNLQKIIEKLFSLCSSFPYIESTLVYLLLINAPTILLSSASLLMHYNLMGFQISCDMDCIQILLVSAYICYVEQSRQTPIRGFLFIRDLTIMICMIGCYVGLCYDGLLRLEYGIAGVVIYFVYYVFMHVEEHLEDSLLRLLGIKQTHAYNSYFLQTQPRKQANYLRLKNTIEQNKQTIEMEIEEYKDMLEKLYSSEDEKQILLNFAKLFLPYKNALEIQENNEVELNIRRISQDWVGSETNEDLPSDEDEDQDGQASMGLDGHESGACLMQNRTMTEDYVLEGEDSIKLESAFDKTLKYIFYPLYIISTVEGRLRYFLDYLCVFLLCGLMWLISCSCSYFVNITNHKSYGIISMLLAFSLAIPSSKYYLGISEIKDFDFINIFLQSSILKSAIFGILIIIQYAINPTAPIKGSIGLMISVILNLVTYMLFGAFMIAQKFATLKANMKFLAILSITSFGMRILAEIVCNLVIYQPTS